jgi:hypothetical protein
VEVSARFNAFLSNIALTDDQIEDGRTKHAGVRNCLNRHYYGLNSETANSRLIGSWGKHTRIRPPRDIDLLFVLPQDVKDRFDRRTGNKQSALLQEVKGVLAKKYSNTDMSGDGCIVLIPFTSYRVEVAPAFKKPFSQQYLIPRTENGGFYKDSDHEAEITKVAQSDEASNGNTRHLIRMLKCWQANCNVPLRSFWLELLAVEFLDSWEHRGKGSTWYDWMVRDFFKFLVGKAKGYLFAPGTFEIMWLGDDWKTKAESAHARAVKATQFEADKMPYSAGGEWQKIFGDDIPTG